MENSVTELRDNFPWGNLKGTVVDIGGGSGHVSIILAQVSEDENGNKSGTERVYCSNSFV